MTSEMLEEMFKGDSADMCARKFRWGDERTLQACADAERGPPSALAEILNLLWVGHERGYRKSRGEILENVLHTFLVWVHFLLIHA